MQFKVEKAFFDRITGVPYNAGSIYESDNLERIVELQNGGYLTSKKVEQVTTGESTQAQTGATEHTRAEIASITETTKPEKTESVVTETPVTNETVTHTDVTPVTEQIATNETVTDEQEVTPVVTPETVVTLNVTEATVETGQVHDESFEVGQDGNLETTKPEQTESVEKDVTTKNSRKTTKKAE